MTELSLYNSCLRRVFFLLRDGFWNSRRVNPFCSLPPEVVHDLVSTTLHLQRSNGLRAADLELLLKSGLIREFKIHAMDVKAEICATLCESLASRCEILESLTLTKLPSFIISEETSQAMKELLRHSPNLRNIHCGVYFDLKALRNCKKLRTIMLHFFPVQPWSGFLGEEHGHLQPLDSLELFTVCMLGPILMAEHQVNDIVTILKYCPSLASFGSLETAKALAEMHRTGILTQVKLRSCWWGTEVYPDYDDPDFENPEYIRDSVTYHPLVEELHFHVEYLHGIGYLSGLRNLVFLDMWAEIEEDLSELFCNVLKDIGARLKYLSFSVICPIDLSAMLQNCPNLEALQICATEFKEFAKPTVSLPNLKYLTYLGSNNGAVRRILPLFSHCNSLRELFLINTFDFDDYVLDEFLRSNSLSNLKVAYIELCSLTMRGFLKFFLNSPELEKIEIKGFTLVANQEVERNVKRALLKTNHTVLFNKNLVHFKDEFFEKRRHCKLY